MIADFRVSHFFSGGDPEPVDDPLNPRNFRCLYESQLFGGDVLHVSRQNQIAILDRDGNRIAMKVDSGIFSSVARISFTMFSSLIIFSPFLC